MPPVVLLLLHWCHVLYYSCSTSATCCINLAPLVPPVVLLLLHWCHLLYYPCSTSATCCITLAPLVPPVVLLLIEYGDKSWKRKRQEGQGCNYEKWNISVWLFVKQIFLNVKPSHDGDSKTFEVMTSTSPLEILASAKTIYRGNHDWNHKLCISYHVRDVYPIYRYCWNAATYKWKVHNWKIE